jgi:hypothetical protein
MLSSILDHIYSQEGEIKKNDRVIKNTLECVLPSPDGMAENVVAPAMSSVAENEVSETELTVPGTSLSENKVTVPDWYSDGDAWVKIFLKPVEPGKFKQFDYIYDVPGTNEFPVERWNAKECQDGFHITPRKYVWYHLDLHDYKSVYIAEVVSMGDEFYDYPYEFKRKVRVVTFGPIVPLADVLGKHPDDFKDGRMLKWSVLTITSTWSNLIFPRIQKYIITRRRSNAPLKMGMTKLLTF